MPRKTKVKNAAIAARSAALPSIPKELIDQFVTGPMSAEAVNAASVAFKKALIERALGAELGHHLGYRADRRWLSSRETRRQRRDTALRNGRHGHWAWSSRSDRAALRCAASHRRSAR